MKDNPEQIRKLVIRPDEIEGEDNWSINLNKNLHSCGNCNSNLSYVKMEWGVVSEDFIFQVMGNRSERTYALREIGLTIYCAECGRFHEHYSKWFYPEDKLIMSFDELEEAEMPEVEYCLNQFNQKGDFKPQYKWSKLGELKKKLIEYEKKYPIKKDGKIKLGKSHKKKNGKRSSNKNKN